MQSRSGKNSSRQECSKRFWGGGSAFATGALPFVGVFWSAAAQATLTATPVSPYALSTNNVVHYQTTSGTSLVDTEAGFRKYNLSTTFVSPDENEALLFDLTSTAAFTVSGTQKLIVSAFVTMGSGDPIAIPLAIGEGSVCSTSNANCQNSVTVSGTDYFRAVRSSTSTSITSVRVGIFPADICTVANSVKPGINATGCTAAALNAPVSGTPTQMVIRFAVAVVADSTVGFELSAASEKTDEITLHFGVDGPTLSCPSMASAYFPGDSSILVGEGFSGTAATNGADIDTLVTIANLSSSGVTTGATFGTANSIVGRNTIGSNSFVTGFTNSTSTTSVLYDVSFAARDVSGALSTFGTPGVSTCALQNVQTADIQGFLKTSKCFIATAAFDSMSVPPVALLREFREKRLRGFAAGRALVALYERFSPPAADWLLENPGFKPAIRVALLPFVAIAWVTLHPREVLLILALAGTGMLALAWFSRAQWRRRGGSRA